MSWQKAIMNNTFIQLCSISFTSLISNICFCSYHKTWGGRKPTYLTSANIRINTFSVVPWGGRKQMSVGKIRMLDGLVSTHYKFLLLTAKLHLCTIQICNQNKNYNISNTYALTAVLPPLALLASLSRVTWQWPLVLLIWCESELKFRIRFNPWAGLAWGLGLGPLFNMRVPIRTLFAASCGQF